MGMATSVKYILFITALLVIGCVSIGDKFSADVALDKNLEQGCWHTDGVWEKVNYPDDWQIVNQAWEKFDCPNRE